MKEEPRPSDVAAEHPRRLEHLYHSAPCNEPYRPRLTVSERSARLRIDVQPSFLNGNGTLHGSVYFKALDDSAAFAVYSTYIVEAAATCGDELVARGSGMFARTNLPLTSLAGYEI